MSSLPLIQLGELRYFTPAAREDLQNVAKDIARPLRLGDLDAVAAVLDRIPALGASGVRDAVLEGGGVHTPAVWSDVPEPSGGPMPVVGWLGNDLDVLRQVAGGHRLFESELYLRPVQQRLFSAEAVLDRTAPRGRAVASTGLSDAHLAAYDVLRGLGTAIVNPVPLMRKSIQAEAWQRAGVATPPTVTRLIDDAAVKAAYRQLGPEVVIKAPADAGGRGVYLVRSLDDAVDVARTLRDERMGPGDELGAPIMQARTDTGSADARVHYARDAVTGRLQPVAAIHRVAVGGEFRSNISQGGMMRPIFDLTGGDTFLPPDAIDEGMRAGDALDLDWYGADVAIDLGTGRPVVFEVDPQATPIDRYFPMPRPLQTYPRLADLLVGATNEVLDAQRGATLRPAMPAQPRG